jgi:hypothetical protein
MISLAPLRARARHGRDVADARQARAPSKKHVERAWGRFLLDGDRTKLETISLTEAPMLLTILLVLLVISLVGGGWGYSRVGAVGMSPFGLLLVLLVVLMLTGNLHA